MVDASWKVVARVPPVPASQATVCWPHFISLVTGPAELVNSGADNLLNLRPNCLQVCHDSFCGFPAGSQSTQPTALPSFGEQILLRISLHTECFCDERRHSNSNTAAKVACWSCTGQLSACASPAETDLQSLTSKQPTHPYQPTHKRTTIPESWSIPSQRTTSEE